jgi:dGTPase
MTKRMDWQKLLSTKRVSDFSHCDSKCKESQLHDPRSPYEKDFDQITFSYAFRRLQDKTQVIPFPKFDFVHTRLTHSLEVASVGRSLGKMAAKIIFKELDPKFLIEENINDSDIGSLVASACLAHDIGNPPFGHSGEDAISYYFINRNSSFSPEFEIKDGKVYHEYYDYEKKENVQHIFELEENIVSYYKNWHDLSNYEGNANGFRIITKNCDKGINPTLALLGTFSKYPKESILIKDPYLQLVGKDYPKSQTKYGFFQDQKDIFKFAAKELGLIKVEGISEFDIAYKRHPLAFLMEASDDIAYGIIDFEDGCRLNLIDFEKLYTEFKLRKKDNSFKNITINKSPKTILTEIARKDNSFDLEKLNSLTDFKQQISYLRSKIVNVLVHLCFEVFEKEYENIMNGTFDKPLIDCINDKEVLENLNLMTELVRKYIYQYPPVLECEASGFEVMEHLISSFAITSNICYSCGEIETTKDKKLRSLLPEEFQPEIEMEIKNLTENEKYKRVLSVLDYITGMTDKFAINLFRKIKGLQN